MLDVDVHAHLLPRFDDGSQDEVEAVSMAQAIESLGVRRVHLTPHQFRFGAERSNDVIRAAVERLGRTLAAAGVELELVACAEYLYGGRLLEALLRGEELLGWPSEDGRRTCVLVEVQPGAASVGIERFAELMARRDRIPVLAHPERVQEVARDPERVLRWREAGWRMQLDVLSTLGHNGRAAQSASRALLQWGAYDFVGSNLRRPRQLPALGRALSRLATAPAQRVSGQYRRISSL